jgi:hypothetical protein
MAGKDVPSRRTCGTMAVHERLLRTVPEYAEARAASETRAWERATLRAGVARTGVTLIPVVVHVVYKTNTQNISSEQIQSQIDVLNHDFRKTNLDVAATPAAFQPLAADARVEFELATTDPQGSTTDGITRTQTTATSFSDDDGVKSAATGGADPWPSDKYLNIWVCQLGGGLLGYAQFPGGPAATDGVVILHSAFGTTGTAAAPFNLGRSATHEIGHWLNLRHIWGDDGTGCNGSDFVDDTPNQASANYGTPSFPHVTCNNGPNGDLFMNYMDYVDDSAMFMFTDGQVTRIQAALDTDRSTIGSVKPGPATLKFKDDPLTLKFSDDGGTLKFGDDQVTLKFRDDIGTLKFADDAGTLKFRDDVKYPMLDKPPALDVAKSPAGDLPGPGPIAPFVLATPHHSMAWTRSYPSAYQATMVSYEQQLLEYERVLEQYAEAQAAGQLTDAERGEGDRLYAEYTELLQEYGQIAGR